MAGLLVLTDRESARVQSTSTGSSKGIACEERPRLPIDGIRRQYIIKSLLRPRRWDPVLQPRSITRPM